MFSENKRKQLQKISEFKGIHFIKIKTSCEMVLTVITTKYHYTNLQKPTEKPGNKYSNWSWELVWPVRSTEVINVRMKPQNALHWERANIKKMDVSTIIIFGRRDIIKTQPKQPVPKTILQKHLINVYEGHWFIAWKAANQSWELSSEILN